MCFRKFIRVNIIMESNNVYMQLVFTKKIEFLFKIVYSNGFDVDYQI